MIGTLLILGFAVLLFSGLPIAFVIGLTSLAWVLTTGLDISIAASRIQGGINSFVLMAIPFFIMAAEVMNKVKITEHLVNFINMIFGRFRGGLAQVCIFTEVLFSGITGSAIADIAALGKIFIPQMAKQGYNKVWATANLTNAVVIGPIIPPSITLVMYGAVTGVSIGALLLGGVIPGVVFALIQSIYVYFVGRRKNFPKIPQQYTVKEYAQSTVKAIPAILMPIIILGGIYTGAVTPTEAAAIAVAYALLLGFFFYRNINVGDLIDVGKKTMRDSGMLYLIIGVSGILGWLLARMGTATALTNFMLSLTDNPTAIFCIVMGILLFMGTWLDSSAIIILVSPIVAPMMHNLGVDPVHFGVVFIVAVSIGIITPPLGVCLFAASGTTGVKVEGIIRELVPFIFLDILIVFLFALVPEITLWLPRMAGFID
jgi:tripartite ATP-independent transporter DctM subunit